MKGDSHQIKIFGMEYTLKGDDDKEYIEELSRYVDKKMNEVSERSALVSTAKVAVLAALRIADELYQAKKEKDADKISASAEKRIKKLIEMVEREVEES